MMGMGFPKAWILIESFVKVDPSLDLEQGVKFEMGEQEGSG